MQGSEKKTSKNNNLRGANLGLRPKFVWPQRKFCVLEFVFAPLHVSA